MQSSPHPCLVLNFKDAVQATGRQQEAERLRVVRVFFFNGFAVLELVYWYVGLLSVEETGGRGTSVLLQSAKYHQQKHQPVPDTPFAACE